MDYKAKFKGIDQISKDGLFLIQFLKTIDTSTNIIFNQSKRNVLNNNKAEKEIKHETQQSYNKNEVENYNKMDLKNRKEVHKQIEKTRRKYEKFSKK